MNLLLCMKGISHSFDFCTAWTSACCRLDLDQCHRVRRRLSKKCKPRTMRADPSAADQSVQATDDAARLHPMSVDRCV